MARNTGDRVHRLERPGKRREYRVLRALERHVVRTLEFDADGNFLQGWGGPGDGYDWPENEHGFDVDPNGFVWITGSVLAIAPVLALGALYRERDAQARNQALRFELERSELEKQALDARLRLLHAQIEPHFLFNTLANVQELVESGSA